MKQKFLSKKKEGDGSNILNTNFPFLRVHGYHSLGIHNKNKFVVMTEDVETAVI